MPVDPEDARICLEADVEAEPGRPAPTSAPIVQTSLFDHATFQDLVDGLASEHSRTVYTRGRNPTVMAAERKIARLERGDSCLCFGSGMGAIGAVLLGLLEAGDHVLFVNQTYGPTLQLAAELRRFGIEHDLLLELDPAALEDALRPETRLLWLESPGTMLFRLLDVAAVARSARERGILTCLDNSWSTPLFQKPLTMGVDLVVHTCTKYLGGHSDLLAGAVVGSRERIERLFYRSYLLLGSVLAPFDAWLLLRGLRTLPVRMEQHERDALRVASHLASHPAVRAVHHPALGGAVEGLGGTSGVFSFELVRDDYDSVRAVLDALEIPLLGVSWGGVESVAISPARPDDAAARARQRLPAGLIRLSVGLEGAAALIADLDRALAVVA
ncbi:MAG: aminotransferase class I/II-fold pyridoxal phosphate-dependent enzyme [Thermoanaerobaculia bacterium]